MSAQNVHDHIENWLDASVKGRLDSGQKQILRDHLAVCHSCLEAACNPDLIARAEDIFSRRGGPDACFEERLLEGLREEAAGRRAERPLVSRPLFKAGLRASLAIVILVLIGIRSMNVRYFRDDSSTGRVLSAMNQVLLRRPSPGALESMPATLQKHERLFAAANQLTKGLSGTLMWLALTTLVLFLARDLWRGLTSRLET